MILLSGLFIICVAVAGTIARRRTREREEAEENSREAFQALMREDLQMFTSQQDKSDGGSLASDVDDSALIRAFDEDAAAQNADVPLVHHESSEDRLFLLYDETQMRRPVISVAPDLVDAEVTRVFMNGALIARVVCSKPIQASDISPMPQSTAQALGLTRRAA